MEKRRGFRGEMERKREMCETGEAGKTRTFDWGENKTKVRG